ncbi:MAG: SpoIIE family protein phosphatase [Blastococcus sp.]
MDDPTDRTAADGLALGARSAVALRQNPARAQETRRLRPLSGDTAGLDRLAELAASLLGAGAAQISLLEHVQVVAGGSGLAPGAVGSTGPLEESLCTVAAGGGKPLLVADARTDTRVSDLPPVRSGAVASYLGMPLVSANGLVVGVLCVFDPAPRTWSEADVEILARLAGPVVTELELSAQVRRNADDRLRWQLAVDAAGIGTFDWDLVTGHLASDDLLIAMFGHVPATFDQSIDAFRERLHPDDARRVEEILQNSIDGCGDYDAEFRIVRPDGDTRWVHARGQVLCGADGTPERLLGAAYDTTGTREAASRVTRVLEAMPAGFYSLDHDWRFTNVNAEGERLLGRTRDDLLGRVVWDEFPEALESPFEDNLRTTAEAGKPVAFDAYYPAPLDAWYEVRAWPSPDGLSVYFLDVTARRRVQVQAERSAQRLAILARVSAEMAGRLDAQEAITHLPELVVPALADFCIVTVVDPDGRPRDVGSWHADPASRPLVARYADVRLEQLAAGSPVARALQTGEAVQAGGDDVLGLLGTGEGHRLLASLAPRFTAVLPLRGRGRTLGLLTLYFGEGPAPDEEDLATAQDVADRAGLALDNARLYSTQQQLAENLQRSLLTEPPEPDHAEIAVRYLPATEAARVGGDWYDAFMQPGGTTMLVIGDVVGHDSEAAAAMGQLRGLLRGIAAYSDAGPGEVLRGLDASMAVLQTNTLATAAVARFEQTLDELDRGVTRMRWANAGHLPPLVINPDGTVAELAAWQGDLLLGVDPEARRRESVVSLERGSTVLLYTDGLIERRDADLDTGLVRLRDAVVELGGLPLDELLDELVERLVDGRPEDDVALVAVRLHRQDLPRPPEAGPIVVPPVVPPDPALV